MGQKQEQGREGENEPQNAKSKAEREKSKTSLFSTLATYVIINAVKEIKPWRFYLYAFIETV